MTRQTQFFGSLGGSLAGVRVSRLCALTLVAVLGAGGALAGTAQEKPSAAKAAKSAEKKPATPADGKVMGGYNVHSMVELGGRFAEKSGSRAMWATMINQTTGARVLNQSVQMRTLDPHKTPFFDRLSSSSFGYGGDPYDVSTLNVSKGKIYDFTGTFRRDRNYFDYNLLVNSLLTTSTPTTPALIAEPSTLHLFNTVRRDTSTLLTLAPLWVVHFRAGFTHDTNEGPSYSTVHQGGDVQVLQWFRNSLDTYIGGVDVNLAKRTTVSYDQFLAFFRGDSPYNVVGLDFALVDGTPVSLGVNTLATATCGTGANRAPEIKNGIVNPYCSLTMVQTQVAPTRTSFPTEQLRFSSRYWDRVAMNGRVTYSGGVSNVNQFNETFTGFLSRTNLRQEIDTGALGNGRLAHNKRVNVNGDFGIEAELNRYISVSDAVNFWNFRIPGLNALTSQVWGNTTEPAHNALTPLSSITPVTDTATNTGFLGQRNLGNTIIGSATVTPQVKISAGWRFNDRQIKFSDDPTMDWHQNWLLLGGVVNPSNMVRVSVNYDMMRSSSANSATTPTNTYTREAPNEINHLRGKLLVKPGKWINLAVAGNDYVAKNTDPLVNHREHNQNISFGAQIIASESLSMDLSYGHDDVFSVTNLCYAFTPNPQAPLPTGAAIAGTCTTDPNNPNLYLGNGYYDAPTNFFVGNINFAPVKYFRVAGGARLNNVDGRAETLNPLQVPGALQSQVLNPYADLVINIAPQWAWHGNWNHHAYDESGPQTPAARNFHGDIYTLGVQYAF